MSLLSAPITLSKIAVGAALLGGDALVAAGRKAGSAATSGAGAAVVMAGSAGNELTAIGAAVIGTLGEAVGGPSVRRRSSTATTRWIEVRGLDTEFDRVSTEVRATLTELLLTGTQVTAQALAAAPLGVLVSVSSRAASWAVSRPHRPSAPHRATARDRCARITGDDDLGRRSGSGRRPHGRGGLPVRGHPPG